MKNITDALYRVLISNSSLYINRDRLYARKYYWSSAVAKVYKYCVPDHSDMLSKFFEFSITKCMH